MPKIMRNGVEYGRYTMTKIMKNNVEYSGSGADSATLALPTTNTASGAIARFNTDLTENLLSAVAEFSATQAEGTPTPAAPIPIVGVDKVNVTRCGKNLFRGYGEKTYIKAGTAYLLSSANTTGAERIRLQVFDKDNNVLSNVTALSGCNGAYYWSGNTLVRANNTTTLNDKIGFDDNRVSNIVAIDDTNTPYHYINYTNIQLELGSTATAYEPYNGTTALINLGGTYYGGSVDAVTGKITLTHRIKIYDKNSTWTMNTSGVFYASAPSGIDDLEMCNYFDVFLPRGSSNAIDDGQCRLNSNRNNINFKILSCETLEDFKTWLGDNTIQVVYELATPIVVYASNTAEILTIVGDNQVFADSGDVAVKYFETVGHKI